jgi:hypothetical protein
LETLLTKNGYKLKKNTNDENALDILKNGVLQRTLSGKQIVFHNKKRWKVKQIRMILKNIKASIPIKFSRWKTDGNKRECFLKKSKKKIGNQN